MSDPNRMQASCHLALAALLHDLGKFVELAEMTSNEAKKDEMAPLKEGDPTGSAGEPGNPAHAHEAYTRMGLERLKPHLPPMDHDVPPFSSWNGQDEDDTFVNAVVKSHTPSTLLQWVIFTAEHLAAGLKTTNPLNDGKHTENRKNRHLWPLFESIRLSEAPVLNQEAKHRYPLKPLSPKAIFPIPAEQAESPDINGDQYSYRKMLERFIKGLESIPTSHRKHLPLWIDHFDTLWLTFTHAIPETTYRHRHKSRPDVSLYDHSRTTAALAVALWRYHTDRQDAPEKTVRELQAQWKSDSNEVEHQQAWSNAKFLLIQGDFTGIQDFIFAGGETQRHAAKLLRGRSFYVSMLSELAALKVLEALDLPPTSQVINAAGKFLIVAPNTDETKQRLHDIQTELDTWFLTHTWGQSTIHLAWMPASAEDFTQEENGRFRQLIRRLFEQLETRKLHRFGLCSSSAPEAVFKGFLDRFEAGACVIDGRSPAHPELDGMSELAWDQIKTGQWLAHQNRILITRMPLQPWSKSQTINQLRLPVFGFSIVFTGPEEASGKFGPEALRGNLLRAWDFSLPDSESEPLWRGYARRNINAYIPRFSEAHEWDNDRYHGIESDEAFLPHPLEPKTLNHIARDDLYLDEKGRWIGVESLMTLKGDIDNLGTLFQTGIDTPNFARMAALSRQINSFFTLWLPWACQKEYKSTYTVFAGGDDFFLIGPWHSTIQLALHMRKRFAEYTVNPQIHFSAGLSMTKPGLPIRHMARLGEEALENAKNLEDKNGNKPKNAVSCFNKTVSWMDFEELMELRKKIEDVHHELGLSSGYLYSLLRLTDMAGGDPNHVFNLLWPSRFAYQTRRMLEKAFKNIGSRTQTENVRRQWQQRLALDIADKGIRKHASAYSIPLFIHLYLHRD